MRIVVIAAFAFIATPAPASAADLEANKLLIRGYIEEVFNKHQPEASDRFVARDFIEHNPRLPHEGLAGTKKFLTIVCAAFSDYHAEIQQLVAEGDWVVSRTQFTGTNDGPYEGRPATGNKLVFSTSDFFRIETGKIAERWDVVETLARAAALGLVPAPNPPAPTPLTPRQRRNQGTRTLHRLLPEEKRRLMRGTVQRAHQHGFALPAE
jgi:predicted ester cyclase